MTELKDRPGVWAEERAAAYSQGVRCGHLDASQRVKRGEYLTTGEAESDAFEAVEAQTTLPDYCKRSWRDGYVVGYRTAFSGKSVPEEYRLMTDKSA